MIAKISFILISFFASVYSYSQKPATLPLSKIENKILDTIAKLKRVKERIAYVEKETKGKRHLKFIIWDKPTKYHPYYWVKVMEDNGLSYYTHFNFYVYPKTMK